jgi:YidC/Oxa1 family membrane protein insertase
MFLPANIFQPLIDVFETVLKFFHNNLGVSWGLAIVLLTVLVRALLIPLTLKQFHSMQKLQRLQPELKSIQQKYKEDKQRQQQELMKFYKENQVNPLGSCLPLVAQLPVFISLFYLLRQDLRKNICPDVQLHFQKAYAAAHHITFHAAAGNTTYCTDPAYAHYYHGGAGFLFIPDLTNRAYGAVLIVLILLYVGTQLGSSLMMMSTNATMDKTQRNLMLFMPLIFVFIMIGFPAGVLLYWITTNAWTILQQYIVRKRIGPPPVLATATAGAVAAGSGGARGGRGAPSAPSRGGTRAGNGAPPTESASEGGLGGMLKNRLRPSDGDKKSDDKKSDAGKKDKKEPAAVGARDARGGPPPPPPKKKKKRSGRRR